MLRRSIAKLLKYGPVPKLPSGKRDKNEYQKIIRRFKGINPNRQQHRGWSRYGVPSLLPDGRPNPKWDEARRRAHGVKPLKRWDGKCTDCREVLAVGENWRPSQKARGFHVCIKCGIVRQTKFRRKKGMSPQGSRYGVPKRLPDGKLNPAYWIARDRANGVNPHPQNWGNTYGVPYTLPNGQANPEWRRRHMKNPKIQLAMKRHQAKRQRGLPTNIIFGHKFDGLVLHHMSPNVAIWIPVEINKIPHNVWTGKNMEKVNRLALGWYFKQWYQ